MGAQIAITTEGFLNYINTEWGPPTRSQQVTGIGEYAILVPPTQPSDGADLYVLYHGLVLRFEYGSQGLDNDIAAQGTAIRVEAINAIATNAIAHLSGGSGTASVPTPPVPTASPPTAVECDQFGNCSDGTTRLLPNYFSPTGLPATSRSTSSISSNASTLALERPRVDAREQSVP